MRSFLVTRYNILIYVYYIYFLMALQPYNFEPTVDDLGTDIQPQNVNNSFLEIDVNGRSKVANINNWCTCEKCCIFSNDIECVCCAEFEKVTPLRSGHKCITESDLFKKIILDEDILNITRHQIILKTKNKSKKKLLTMSILSNSSWRFICYTQYTHWINSWSSLGKGVRVVIPACVVKTIREKYPEVNGVYVGFKNGSKLPN